MAEGSSPESLYAAVLGREFAELSPALQRFHGQASGGLAKGAVEVRRGPGLLARVAGWGMGAPPAGQGVPVELRVDVDGGVERWIRHFAGRPLNTRQWRVGDRLVEAVGLSQLHFDLRVEAGGMVFEQRSCTVLGLALPRALAPRVEARVTAAGDPETPGDQWDIFVSISLPLVGFVVSYAGTMRTV